MHANNRPTPEAETVPVAIALQSYVDCHLPRDDSKCSIANYAIEINDLSIYLLLLGRVALVRGVAGYSHQTFPWTTCRSVGRSVHAVHCGKTADWIRMPFSIICRTGPGMRQVVGFGDRYTGRGTFGPNLGRAIVSNGDLTVYVCDNTSTVGAAVWGGACGGLRHCCIRWVST